MHAAGDYDHRYMRCAVVLLLSCPQESSHGCNGMRGNIIIATASGISHLLNVHRDESRLPPWCIFRLVLLVLRLLNWLQTAMLPPAMRIADLAYGGYTLAEVLRTAAALGLADRLANGPKTAQALARELGRNMSRASLR